MRRGSSPPLRAGSRYWRPAALSACAPRFMGQGHPRAVLRSRGDRRGARSGGRAHVRRRLQRRVFCHGAGRGDLGIRMMLPPTALDALSAPARDFAERAKSRLSQTPPDQLDAAVSLDELASQYGDHRMAADIATVLADRPFRAAAVLVPVVAHERPAFLLTQRSSDLSSHSGQVAFPGGRIDEGDADPAAAAVRESEEEIGLRREFVSTLGYLDPYISRTRFR